MSGLTDVPRVPWSHALARRQARHLLSGDGATSPVEVAGRLLGVQAQVTSSAEQAVAVRGPAASSVRDGLADGSLVRTWAARGTLHVLDTAAAPDLLALLAAARSWEKGAWQREFATADEIARLADLVVDVVAGSSPTRDELVAALAPHVSPELAGRLASGWGTLLKPLAWQGLLVNGEPRGSRPTFTAPPWRELPDPDTAARSVVPAYLDVHGPASPETFDAWLLRGATPRRTLRRWFAELVDEGAIVPVAMHPDGAPDAAETLYARAADVPGLSVPPPPQDSVRFLPAFDQWVLGPGTRDPHVLPPEHRSRVSRTAGWIAPVVIRSGRIVGTWSGSDVADVELFPGETALPDDDVAAEQERWRRVLGP
ncbi:DNA glycosylase AlkZ-like family protein [Actinomycetospora termitidis]|uniref:Crosslink repair DNA glycosylase YcaQ family protein n=1 Tax=Actinomycetospora termitidis TaxID=3053470 RepID=A0ABT7MDC9_9PSEU|nr:crosslink repair DNA glycosylase YcaQ family protein [Actinomycetospora sp. Odt1-22]MDL5158671.1 crosslink repair DNA glycosylase YcaQ family protein [Actinomycetospora sp. Odt1-22]